MHIQEIQTSESSIKKRERSAHTRPRSPHRPEIRLLEPDSSAYLAFALSPGAPGPTHEPKRLESGTLDPQAAALAYRPSGSYDPPIALPESEVQTPPFLKRLHPLKDPFLIDYYPHYRLNLQIIPTLDKVMKKASCGRIKTRLFVPCSLEPEACVTLSKVQIHKVRNVLRLSPGDPVGVFNGQHGEWKGRLEQQKIWYVQLETQLRPQRPETDLWLLFAPLKQTATMYLIEKATELGISKFQPVLTERSIVRKINETKLHTYAIEAAEQSDRLSIPGFEPIRPLRTLLAHWPEQTRDLFLCAENGSGAPILKTFFSHHAPAAILTGPEGGFTPAEFEDFSRWPFITPVDLGTRLLRAETAAHAAITCWQAAAGDWNPDRPQH